MARQLKYDQARLAVLNIIAMDGLKSGERLPPERQLISRVNCSMITLRKALTVLEEEGMIERSIGRGTYLRRPVGRNSLQGRILFINVNRPGEISYPPPEAREYMQDYFSRRGLDFSYLQLGDFSDEVVQAADGARGIMLYGWLKPPFVESLRCLKLPMIIVGNSHPVTGVPQVSLNVVQCAELVTSTLISRGARKLAFINAEPAFYLARDIEAGFRKAMASAGIKPNPEWMIAPDYATLPSVLDDFLPNVRHCDAVVLETGVYIGVLTACRLHGWAFPPRLGILPVHDDGINHFNCHLFRAGANTIFGCAANPSGSLFRCASEILLAHILNDQPMRSEKLNSVIDDGERKLGNEPKI